MPSRPHSREDQPPAPPSRRQLAFSVTQVTGICLLALLPAAALFDAFGTREKTTGATAADITLSVTHSPRVRYGSPTRIQINVRASRGEASGPITVRIDSAYLEKFMQISMSPEPDDIDARQHTFVLPASAAEKVVLIELEPEHYGWVRGDITATTENDRTSATVPLAAFVFP